MCLAKVAGGVLRLTSDEHLRREVHFPHLGVQPGEPGDKRAGSYPNVDQTLPGSYTNEFRDLGKGLSDPVRGPAPPAQDP